MKSFHIHIRGRVQGVGFRPFVYKLAEQMGIKGWISNSTDGVHIEITSDEAIALQLYHTIIQSPPKHSIINHHHIDEIPLIAFESFLIEESISQKKICSIRLHLLADPLLIHRMGPGAAVKYCRSL